MSKYSDSDNVSDSDNDDKIMCKHCAKIFNDNIALNRHVNHNCQKAKIYREKIKERNKFEEKITEIKKELEKKLKEEFYEELNQIKKQLNHASIINNNNGTINNSNTINNIANTIILVDFGKENISKINKDKIADSIRYSGRFASSELTKIVHFNPDYPEYQNVYVKNAKEKNGKIFDGTQWKSQHTKKIIDKIYNNNTEYLSENFEELSNIAKLTEERKGDFLEGISNNKTSPLIIKIKNEIGTILEKNSDTLKLKFINNNNIDECNDIRALYDNDDRNTMLNNKKKIKK